MQPRAKARNSAKTGNFFIFFHFKKERASFLSKISRARIRISSYSVLKCVWYVQKKILYAFNEKNGDGGSDGINLKILYIFDIQKRI